MDFTPSVHSLFYSLEKENKIKNKQMSCVSGHTYFLFKMAYMIEIIKNPIKFSKKKKIKVIEKEEKKEILY